MRELSHLSPPRSFLPAHPVVRVAVFVLTSVLVSMGVGWGVSQSPLATPQLSATLYLVEDSQAEFFLSDSFGNISPDAGVAQDVIAGVNNLTFSLRDTGTETALVQRFDPCACDTPVAVQRIGVDSLFFHHTVGAQQLVATNGVLAAEGSTLFFSPNELSEDPQITLYLDISALEDSSRLVTWWVTAGLLVSIGLILMGSLATLRFARGRKRGEGPSRLVLRMQERAAHRPPLTVGILAAVGVLVAMVQQVLGGRAIGVTVDEPLHVDHLANFFVTGTYSSAAYGPVTSLFGHLFNVVAGTEVWGEPLPSAEAYALRHLSIALLGIVGTLAVMGTAWMLFDSKRWALVSGALLGAIPLWVGHSMFNPKDTPVATAYSLVTLGLVALFARNLTPVKRALFSWGPLILGLVLGLGTRPGMAPFFAVSVSLALVLWFLTRSSPASRRARAAYAAAALGGLGVVTTALLVFTQPGRSLVAAAVRSADFPWEGINLYFGERIPSTPGILPVLAVIGASLPVVISLLAVVGLVGIAIASLRRNAPEWWDHKHLVMAVLVITQATGALLAIAVLDPTIYDGVRQILFVVPALALLATVGLREVWIFLAPRTSSTLWSGGALTAVVTISLVGVHVDQLRLFPYNYVYYNSIAQGSGISGQWQTDYWGASLRELAAPVRRQDPLTCRSVGNLGFPRSEALPCGSAAPYTGAGASTGESKLGDTEFWVAQSSRTFTSFGPVSSDNCVFNSEVSRTLRGEALVLSRLYQCEDF